MGKDILNEDDRLLDGVKRVSDDVLENVTGGEDEPKANSKGYMERRVCYCRFCKADQKCLILRQTVECLTCHNKWPYGLY